jgi:hypothetical protein
MNIHISQHILLQFLPDADFPLLRTNQVKSLSQNQISLKRFIKTWHEGSLSEKRTFKNENAPKYNLGNKYYAALRVLV